MGQKKKRDKLDFGNKTFPMFFLEFVQTFEWLFTGCGFIMNKPLT